MTDTITVDEDPEFNPRVDAWPTSRKVGFGLFALIPLLFFTLALFAGLATAAGLAPLGPAAALFYVHVGSQFIVLLVFAHLLVSNREFHGAATNAWAVFFLVLAPVAIPTYWMLHIWNAGVPEDSHHITVRTIALTH